MKHRLAWHRLIIVAIALLTAPLLADVQVGALFTDHVVLQREMPIKVWGKATAGEKITVTLADRTAGTAAADDGTWKVTLDKLPAGGPHEMTIAGSNTVTIKDVLVGEVWVCSGQSNMNMPIDWGVFGQFGTPECTAALAKIDDPQLRMFAVADQVAWTPATQVSGQWAIAKGNNVLKWSATGYFFGAELRRELGVPVGIIESSVGGTLIESWMSRPSLLGVRADYKAQLDRWDKQVAAFDKADYQKKVDEWQKEVDKAKAEGNKPPRKPVPITENNRAPAVLHDGMIAPLVPFAVRGVAWYQGESNVHNGFAYRKLFPAMIQDWRREWSQGDMPFLFVQLANFGKIPEQPGDSGWAEVRESQLLALAEPNTAMAVTIDIGDPANIHPTNKQDVGKRLCLAALKRAYGKDIVFSGPIYQKMAVQEKTIKLTFSNLGGGLKSKDNAKLTGFAIAGEDRKFVWADAKIDGDTVVVSSEQVANPVAVRYGWADSPQCNLYNKEGLPASPFRTDDWPLSTAAKN